MKKIFTHGLLMAVLLTIYAVSVAGPLVSAAKAEDPGYRNEIKDPGVALDPAVAEAHSACPDCQIIVDEYNKYATSYNRNLRSVAQSKRLAAIGEQVILSTTSDIQKKQQLMQTPDVEAQITKLKKDMEDYKTDSAKDKQKLENLLKTQADLLTKMKEAGEKIAECEKKCAGKNKTGTAPAATPAGDDAGPVRLPGFIYDGNGAITGLERHGDKLGYQTKCPRCEMLAHIYNDIGISLEDNLRTIERLEKEKKEQDEYFVEMAERSYQKLSIEKAGRFYARMIEVEEEYDAAIKLRQADADELTEQLRALAAKLSECEKQCLSKEGSAPGAPATGVLPFDWQGPYKTDCEACSKLVAELNRLPSLALERLIHLQVNKRLISRFTEALKSPDSAKLVRRYMGIFDVPGKPEEKPQTADDVKKMVDDKEAENQKIQADLDKITDQFNKVLKMLADCEKQCKVGCADAAETLASLPFDKRMEAQRKTSDILSGKLRKRIEAEAAAAQKYRTLTAELNGRHGPNGMAEADYQSALADLKAQEDRELAPLHKASTEARQCLGDYMKALAGAMRARH